MNDNFEVIDFIVEKMMDVLDYIYVNYYRHNEKSEVNIELGNLYTIYEEEEDIEKDYVIVQTCNKSYI
tara:strand:+ start:369 stop:572 length:204 start_codon:yes stop_codon:yes gene_type:complete